MKEEKNLFVGDDELTGIDGLLDLTRVLTINGATNGDAGAEDLLNGAREGLGKRAGTHDTSNSLNVIEGNVTSVLNVLLLLLITRRLVQSLDDKGGGRGDDLNSGLTVLDGQLAGNTETLPVLGGLGDIITNLLGGKTERTDLGGEGSGVGAFTTDGTNIKLDLLTGINLGGHFN